MQKITPCLWFNGRVEEALEFYTSVFKDSKINEVTHYGPDMPMPEGEILTATFILEGQEFMMLNGGPQFVPNEAISFVINCKNQADIDHYWNSLTANGGRESECGWLVDPYGISWQVVPAGFGELIKKSGPNANKVMQALLQMKKLNIAALEDAAKG